MIRLPGQRSTTNCGHTVAMKSTLFASPRKSPDGDEPVYKASRQNDLPVSPHAHVTSEYAVGQRQASITMTLRISEELRDGGGEFKQ
jgi:hypothetical protein